MKSSDEMYRSVLAKAEAKKEQIRKRNRTFRSAMVAFACALFAFVLGAGLERRIRLPYEPTAAVSITSSVNAAESPVTPSKGPGRGNGVYQRAGGGSGNSADRHGNRGTAYADTGSRDAVPRAGMREK